MKLCIPAETAPNEQRVALVPEVAAHFIKEGHELFIEEGAGVASGFPDRTYEEAGVSVLQSPEELYSKAEILLKVAPPGLHPAAGKEEMAMIPPGALLISFLYLLRDPSLAAAAAKRGVDLFAMEMIPRITRAQSMDALSSQTNLAGYRAVLLGANYLYKILPMMMTAAGTIPPARAVILGAGVAGLQAVATARRLGAVVEVQDVRPEVREQVESLGGRFIAPPETENQSGEGGYAKKATEEYLRKQQETLQKHLKEADLIITTAQVPGNRAPLLITEEMCDGLKPGTVVVDLAAGQGGNCARSRPDETFLQGGVTYLGPTNLPATLPANASRLYAKNLQSLLRLLIREGRLHLDTNDEIINGALVVRGGEIRNNQVARLLSTPEV